MERVCDFPLQVLVVAYVFSDGNALTVAGAARGTILVALSMVPMWQVVRILQIGNSTVFPQAHMHASIHVCTFHVARLALVMTLGFGLGGIGPWLYSHGRVVLSPC